MHEVHGSFVAKESALPAAPAAAANSIWPHRHLAGLTARIGLACPFLLSALSKVAGWPASVGEARGLGLPLPMLVVLATIAVQTVGSVLLLISRSSSHGAWLLGGFTALATLVAHRFWNAAPAEAPQQFATFTEHIAILGGLLAAALLATGDKARG